MAPSRPSPPPHSTRTRYLKSHPPEVSYIDRYGRYVRSIHIHMYVPSQSITLADCTVVESLWFFILCVRLDRCDEVPAMCPDDTQAPIHGASGNKAQAARGEWQGAHVAPANCIK